MADKRAITGGAGLVIGAVPLILFYGAAPLGYAGVAIAVFGLFVIYAAVNF
jgi:hypothetical protein